jgi:acyl-CoA thioesterase FadM
MERIKIKLPAVFNFKTEISLRITDINYGGHLGNDKVLSLVHEARLRYLNSFGYSEMKVEGFGTIMADAAVEYKSQGFYGDVIQIEVAAGEFDKFGFDLYYKLTNKDSGKAIAYVKTGVVIFDYNNKKIVQIPEEAVKKLKNG